MQSMMRVVVVITSAQSLVFTVQKHSSAQGFVFVTDPSRRIGEESGIYRSAQQKSQRPELFGHKSWGNKASRELLHVAVAVCWGARPLGFGYVSCALQVDFSGGSVAIV